MVPTEWLAMARSFLPVSDTFFFLNSSPIRALIASNILPASWSSPKRGEKKVLTSYWHIWYIWYMGELHIKIQDDIRDKFKSLCALKRSTMQEEVLHFIKKEVEKAGMGKS